MIFDKKNKTKSHNNSISKNAFRNRLSAKKKIIRALDIVFKKISHSLGEFEISSKWLEQRAEEIIKENKINGYLKNDGIYLDIGCGKGHIMYELEKINLKRKVRFFGIDISDYPIKRVKERIAKIRGISQTFAFASAEKLPFEDGHFDGTAMFYLLHHLDLDLQKKAIKEAKRIIGDDLDQYIFVLEEIVDSETQRKISEKNDMLLNPEIKRGSHNYRSDRELIDLFQKAGLEIVKSHYYLTGTKKRPLKNAFYVLRKI